jgi:hypothetical protein
MRTQIFANDEGSEKGHCPLTKLTVDEAVAEFQLMLRAELGTLPRPAPGEGGGLPTPEVDEELRFRAAEMLLRIACPDLSLCTDRRCRRGGLCRHLADLALRREGRYRIPNSRRTPGALALRHAIWVCMNGET